MILSKAIYKSILTSICLMAFHQIAEAQTLTTIAEAKTKIGQNIKVTGIVTTDGILDNRSRYFQDATGGLLVFETGNPDIQALAIGDSIVVSGPLIEFSGLAEISGTGIVIEKIASGKPVPEARPSLATDMVELYEGSLMLFEGVTFERAGGVFSRGNFNFTDAEGNVGVMRLSDNSHPLINKDIPAGKSTLIGVLSQFNAIYQLLPRSGEDLIVGFAVISFEQTDIQNRSSSFKWVTNKKGPSGLRYREVGTEDFDSIYVAGAFNNHEATVGGLRPATLYELQAFSYIEGDTTFSPINTVATRSESTGDIKAYFNKPLLAGSSTGIYIENAFADTIAAYIDRATTSVDVAVYNSNAGANVIMQALNNAKTKGLRVRYIADGGQANTGLSSLNGSVALLKSNADAGIMHNKFVVIDAGSRDHSYVISSSCNWTSNGLNDDPNNMLIIQDQAIANTYQREFEEMWGGSGNTPTLANIRFGASKTRNTPTQFIVGGNPMEVYFSPTDGANNAILEGLNNVNSDLRFSTLLITRSDIADKISALHTNGWSVKGIIDDTTDIIGSQFVFMKEAGVDVHLYQPSVLPGQFHHKYAIIDALKPESDPTVITGSHNWSSAAEQTNDENTIVIHNTTVASLFLNEFRQRYLDLTGASDDVLTGIASGVQELSIFPNPSQGTFYLNTTKPSAVQIIVTDVFGRVVYKNHIENTTAQTEAANLSHLNNGIYLMNLVQDGKAKVYRIVLNK